MKKGGAHCLSLCGALVRAVRLESVVAVSHHFGVSPHTVAKWCKALGVPEVNEAIRRLMRDWAEGREDDRLVRARVNALAPESVEKRAAPRRGKSPHPNLAKAQRETTKRPRSEHWKQKMRARFREGSN